MLEEILARVGGASGRSALFRASHALARTVLLHAPGSKQLAYVPYEAGMRLRTRAVGPAAAARGSWSPALERLLGARWQPLQQLVDLQLVVANAQGRLPLCPPACVRRHVSHLHLRQVGGLTPGDLASWRLHDPQWWPHLQHLTVDRCGLPKEGDTRDGAGGGGQHALLPIPRLTSLTWRDDFEHACMDPSALASLASHATRLDLDLDFVPSQMGTEGRFSEAHQLLQGMPRLTHAHLHHPARDMEVSALLDHPTLQHVALDNLFLTVGDDFSEEDCRWHSLMPPMGHGPTLELLPLRGLQRLTLRQSLGGWTDIPLEEGEEEEEEQQQPQEERYVVVLRELHARGGLELLPCSDAFAWRTWRLPPGAGLFSVEDTRSAAMTCALVRLMLEAGRPAGVQALGLDRVGVLEVGTQQGVAELLQQHGGHVHTLCVTLKDGTSVSEDGVARWLGALPATVTHVRITCRGVSDEQLQTLVRGAGQARGARHSALTLTLLHWGSIHASLRANLLQLAGAGAGLALEVVNCSGGAA